MRCPLFCVYKGKGNCMFLRLTGLDNILRLINCDHITAIYLDVVKGKNVTKIGLIDGCYLAVQETVSTISLLLQSANRVVS